MNGNQVLPLDGDDWQIYPLLPEEWRWRGVWRDDPPAAAWRRIPARVPGHAQSALLAAGLLPHPYQGLNSYLWEWTSARDWIYQRTFAPPVEWSGRRLWLHFEGVDGAAHVFVNGQEAGRHDESFLPAEFEVSGLVEPGAENRLCVVVERAPDLQGQIGWTSRQRIWRGRFAYGWDFAPRMPPVGIWDSVFLRATGEVSLGEVAIHTNLSEDRAEASISVVSDLRGPGPTSTAVVVEILLDGMPVCGTQDSLTVSGRETSLVQSLRIPRVQLWWPNGAGRQPLYEARLTLKDPHGGVLDLRSIEFGVRSVEMRPNEGAPPDSLPYTLVVNGRRLFVKGCNWVPADLLYGGVDRSRLNRLLVMAQAAGVNMLRVWGGGLLETETFYQICDRLGILVWQEFPQCSSGLDNCPPSDEAYLDRIRAVAPGMIARRRNHPCLALWCGGNELAGADSLPIGSEHPALAELRQLAAAHDPLRAWLPASPSGPTFASDPARRGEMHDVHGPWHYLGPAEHSAFYNDIDPQLHSEFGCEGTAPLETLRWLAGDTGDEVLWPADRANPFWMHHGGESWLRPERVETAFGAPAVLEDFVRASQFLQAEGIRYAIESNRRRKWRCSGTMPWQFNEPWPNAICTSLVDYFGRPKPAYWTMRRAYAPLHVSLAYRTLVWSAEREFQADVWLHNSGAAVSLINIAVTITALDGRALHQENLAAEAPSEAAERVGDVAWRFPADFQDVFLVHLEVIDEEGDRLAENGYVHSRAPAPPFASLLRAPPTSLELSRDRGVTVRNAGRAPALVVIVEASDDGGPRVGESWFVFPPGETRHMEVGSSGPARARAWNAPAVTA